MRTLTLAVTIAAAVVMSAHAVVAQVVLGSVVMPDSTPVPGVIVTATDVRGATIGRALTTQRGEFVLRLSAAGEMTLGVLRIGYRPTAGPTLTVAEHGTGHARIVFIARAVVLAAAGVREKETCRVSSDTGFIVARVWEEARKAMLTSQLSADGAPLFAEWIEYDRTLDSTSRIVREQSVHTTRNPTTHAFRSAPAEVMRDQGFVVADSNGTIYYAPDADALLSDVFVSGHCFRLVTSPEDSNVALVGVAFAPTRERRDMREIEGILWVDRTTSELRMLEFRYINLPDAAEPARPGGLVEFRRLADGNWFVSRWSVRMPQLAAKARKSADGFRKTILTRSPSVLRAVQVAGGEVTRALRGDSVAYQATGPSITVQLLAEDSTMRLSDASLALEGTDYVGTADSLGRIRLSPILAGRYRAHIRTGLMDLLDVPSVVRELETRQDARVDSLALPTAHDALASACPGDSIQGGEGLVYGQVRDARAREMPDVTVTTTWKTDVTVVGERGGAHLAYSVRTLEARTDSRGRWRMCGLPVRTALLVRAATDSGSDMQGAQLNDHALASVDLMVHRAMTSAGELDAGKPTIARALLEIIVQDDHGIPLPGTALEVESRDGPKRTLVAGRTGRALAPDVALGRVIVRARHLGFTPGEIAINVESASVTIPMVMGIASTPTLDTMRIVGARSVAGRLEEFETRRRLHQATVSITREEIEKRNPVDAWQMLTGVAGVNVAVRDYKVVATSRRAMISRFDNEPCFLLVMVDGLMMNKMGADAGFNLQQLPAPDEIHGIEVFAGPATIPPQYGGTGNGKWCGLIAIWTR